MYQKEHELVPGITSLHSGDLLQQLHLVSATLQYFLEENFVKEFSFIGGSLSLPIVNVHTKALSFFVKKEEKAVVQLILNNLSYRSFTIYSRIYFGGALYSCVCVTHVVLNRRTSMTIPLPVELKEKLFLLDGREKDVCV